MLDLVLYIILISIALMAFGLGQNILRERKIKKYFRENGLRFILVCSDSSMKAKWVAEIDRDKYQEIEILDVNSKEYSYNIMDSKIFETTVHKLGIMKYPCLLILEDNRIEGRHFETN